jgi:hypothetical protein
MDEESTPNDQIYSRGRTSFFDSENNSEFGLAVPAVGVHHWRMAIRSRVFASEHAVCVMAASARGRSLAPCSCKRTNGTDVAAGWRCCRGG